MSPLTLLPLLARTAIPVGQIYVAKKAYDNVIYLIPVLAIGVVGLGIIAFSD